jgi:hypothetical protein
VQLRHFVISIFLFSGSANVCSGQGLGSIPFIKPGGFGMGKAFAVPTIKDFNQFGKGYAKHLKMLDQRSEKAYRKAFLKFMVIEDELLYTLCETDEYKANMLMRSAHASFGKVEYDRQKLTPRQQQDYSHSAEVLHKVANITATKTETEAVKTAKDANDQNQLRFATNLYSNYMRTRIMLYDKSFKDGTKEQKKLLRELKRKEFLWRAYKDEDQNLTSAFSKKHEGLMKSVQRSPEFKSSDVLTSPMADIKRLAASAAPNTSFSKESLLNEFREKFKGVLPDKLLDDKGKLANISSLLKELASIQQSVEDSIAKVNGVKEKIKTPDTDRTQAKRFWDRLYGGIDAGAERGTRFYPTGLRITGTGGFNISKNSGFNLELSTVLNGEHLSFNTKEYLYGEIVSNYTAGANLDYRLWKVFFAGAGAELIVNQIEAPVSEFIRQQRYATYTLGVPLIVKAILPVSGKNSTTLELRYDINNKNNVKPLFDFRVGFLIGRR